MYILKKFFNDYLLILLVTLICIFSGFFIKDTGYLIEGILIFVLLAAKKIVALHIIPRFFLKSRITVDKKIEHSTVIIDDEPRNVKLDSIAEGDVVQINAGEYIPVDGVVINGEGFVNTKEITADGEPRAINVGSEVLCGYINLENSIKVKAACDYSGTSYKRTRDLADFTCRTDFSTRRFLRRIAYLLKPAAAIAGLILFIIRFFVPGIPFLAPLIVIALSGFDLLPTIARKLAAREVYRLIDRGTLIKDAQTFEKLRRAKAVVIDIHQSLLREGFTVNNFVVPAGGTKQKLFENAAYVLSMSEHKAFMAAYDFIEFIPEKEKIEQFVEVFGEGASVIVDDRKIVGGNIEYIKRADVILPYTLINTDGLHFALDGEYIGSLTFGSTIIRECINLIDDLKRLNISDIFLFTDDAAGDEEELKAMLGVKYAYCGMSKLRKAEVIPRELARQAVYLCNNPRSSIECNFGVRVFVDSFRLDKSDDEVDIFIAGMFPGRTTDCISGALNTIRFIKLSAWCVIFFKLLIYTLAFFGDIDLIGAVAADVILTLIGELI